MFTATIWFTQHFHTPIKQIDQKHPQQPNASSWHHKDSKSSTTPSKPTTYQIYSTHNKTQFSTTHPKTTQPTGNKSHEPLTTTSTNDHNFKFKNMQPFLIKNKYEPAVLVKTIHIWYPWPPSLSRKGAMIISKLYLRMVKWSSSSLLGRKVGYKEYRSRSRILHMILFP